MRFYQIYDILALVCVVLAILISVYYIGYQLGIRKAVTSDGYLTEDKFILVVDGEEYWWDGD